MLKKVRFGFLYISREEQKILQEKLEREGIEKVLYLGDGIEPGDDEIFLTDCPAGELWAKETGCPTLGIERKDRLSGRYIVLDWQWITLSYLDRIYRRFWGLPWTIFETERCLVREMTPEDMESLYVLYKDKEITRYVEPLYEDREKEKIYIQDHITHMYGFFEYGMWLVLSKDTGELIGRAGICNREINGNLEPELGYVIGKKYQRQGYGLEVCREILVYAKEELDMDFLNCFMEEENLASIALAEKLGFQKIQKEKIQNLLWYQKKL